MMRVNSFTSNFKVYIKRCFAIIVLLTVLFSICNEYMSYTRKGVEGPFPELYTYVDDNTVDVLCVGSSHVFCNINTIQLFEEYGIAAYDFAGSAQSMRISYFSILDILKKQNPRVIILDVYAVAVEESCYTDGIIDSNLMTMPISWFKLCAYRAMKENNWISGFLEFPITHTRYDELTSSAFAENHDTYLGYEYRTEANPQEETSNPNLVKEVSFPYPKAEEYLRKTIELCQEKGISIVLVNAPNPAATEEDHRKYNYVTQMAEEYNIPFLNGCASASEIGIDYGTDCFDSNHLNNVGASKYTEWLAQYLVSNYNLEDRRNSEKHSFWRESIERFEQIQLNTEEHAISNFDANIRFLLENKNFVAFVLYNGYGEELSQETQALLSENSIILNEPGLLLIRNGKIENYYQLSEKYEGCVWIDQHIISFKGEDGNQILKNGDEILLELKDSQVPQINMYIVNDLLGFGSWDKKEY